MADDKRKHKKQKPNGHIPKRHRPKPPGWQDSFVDDEGTHLSYTQKERDPDEEGDSDN